MTLQNPSPPAPYLQQHGGAHRGAEGGGIRPPCGEPAKFSCLGAGVPREETAQIKAHTPWSGVTWAFGGDGNAGKIKPSCMVTGEKVTNTFLL